MISYQINQPQLILINHDNNTTMDILFLGNGGGRAVIATNYTSTGGFVFECENELVICEPGICSFDNFMISGYSPNQIKGIIVTHNHLDHVHDLLRYLEAIDYIAGNKPVLLGSKNVIEGDGHYEKFVSSYHAKKANCFIGSAGQTVQIGKIRFKLTKTHHDEPSCFGFVAEDEGQKIGYTSDTEYYDSFENQFLGCDVLIINNLKPEEDGIPDHLHTGNTINILKSVKPKLAILYHLGMSMFRKGIELESLKIENETGVRTVASEPFLDIIRINGEYATRKREIKKESWLK